MVLYLNMDISLVMTDPFTSNSNFMPNLLRRTYRFIVHTDLRIIEHPPG